MQRTVKQSQNTYVPAPDTYKTLAKENTTTPARKRNPADIRFAPNLYFRISKGIQADRARGLLSGCLDARVFDGRAAATFGTVGARRDGSRARFGLVAVVSRRRTTAHRPGDVGEKHEPSRPYG